MSNSVTLNDQESQPLPKAVIAIYIFILLWALIGLIAFITSLVCFGRSGSTTEKIIGLLLAIFFGPLYFIFYAFNSNYCR
jgi:fatty acid desaturase